MSVPTAVRSTPNLSIPSTQNTAPVFEYRCLWTQDLRKKKKTWHDGSLKYHTFNKRLMVWDDQKNYIGDAHWRQTLDIQEGDELSLDRGALVEVGERISSTVTDLTPLRETVRQHAAKANTNGSNAARDLSHAPKLMSSATRLQWQPKPLSAILGHSQGPIGRARLPTKSPFEEHQHQLRVQAVDTTPPTKRIRLSTDHANQHQPKIAPIMRSENLTPHLTTNITSNKPARVLTHPYQAPPVVNSSNDATPQLQRSNGLSRPILQERHNIQSRAKAPAACVRTAIVSKSADTSSSVTRTWSETAASEARYSRKTQRVQPKAPSDGPTTTLRFAKHPPRRKLLYKDLLLPKTITEQPSAATGDASTGKALSKNKETRLRRIVDLSAIFENSPMSQDPTLIPSSPRAVSPLFFSSVPCSQENAIIISSSPDAVLSTCPSTPAVQAHDGVRASHHAPDNRDEDFVIAANNEETGDVFRSTESSPRITVQTKEQLLSCPNAGSRLSPSAETSSGDDGHSGTADLKGMSATGSFGKLGPSMRDSASPTSLRLALLDRQFPLLTNDHRSHIGIEVNAIYGKVSVTETPLQAANASTHTQEDVVVHVLQGPADAPLQEEHTSGVPTPDLDQSSQPRPFRRVKSVEESPSRKGSPDQSITRSIAGPPSEQLVRSDDFDSEEAEDNARGPWTTHEAWDLFEWWPESREKPNYPSIGNENQLNGERPQLEDNIPPEMTGFTSAINVL